MPRITDAIRLAIYDISTTWGPLDNRIQRDKDDEQDFLLDEARDFLRAVERLHDITQTMVDTLGRQARLTP